MANNNGQKGNQHKTRFFSIDINELIALEYKFIVHTDNQLSTLKDESLLEPFEDKLLAEFRNQKTDQKLSIKCFYSLLI